MTDTDLVRQLDGAKNDPRAVAATSSPHWRRARPTWGDGTQHWLAALDAIEALRPTAVVSGHKRDGDPDSPADIERTRRYIHDYAAAEKADSHIELYEMMTDLYPHRLNRGVLWNSARAAMT